MDRYLDAQSVCRTLVEAGYPTMLAGGCVRDRLLGQEPKDYDLATAALPETVFKLFKAKGFRIIPVGLEHGTVSLVTALQQLEITTLRVDLDCDGRRAQVAFGQDFEADAQRRDFTINALFEDHNGLIHDYVEGQADLRQGILRFVGRAEERIREDYLRILRYFRFLGRLGWPARPAELTAISQNLSGLDQLSAERILKELGLLLVSPKAGLALEEMARCGALLALCPWFKLERATSVAHWITELVLQDPIFHWHLFFEGGAGPWDPKNLELLLRTMRFSKKAQRSLLAVSQLVVPVGSVWERLVVLLKQHKYLEINLEELSDYLTRFSDRLGEKPAPELFSLLQGLQERTDPEIHNPTLMSHPPARRGWIVDLARIYWYLGRIHDTNELSDVVLRPDHYLEQLSLSSP